MKRGKFVRLSPQAFALIERLAAHLGLSQAAVVESAVRALAKKEKVTYGEGEKQHT